MLLDRLLWYVQLCLHGTHHKSICHYLCICHHEKLLRYGFCHTTILNKDSKFFGVCCKAINLLKINCHILSSANHNPMIVERVNQYLMKGLKITCNERDSVRVALEAILLLLYAWNSCPVPGTDILCSLIVVGCEFAFPIDFSSGKHWELTSSPSTVVLYSKELATCLSACCQVAKILVREQCSNHWELINACCPNLGIYSLGNIVFAWRGKIRFLPRSCQQAGICLHLAMAHFCYPYRSLYKLEHCDDPSKKEENNASDLSPYPTKLIPFQPVDGTNTRYRQIYKPIAAHPFKEAGLNGFSPIQPFRVAANLAQTNQCAAFHWPSLSELNDEIAPFPWASDEEYERYTMLVDSLSTLPVLTTGPPPAAPNQSSLASLLSIYSRLPSSRVQINFSLSLTILAPTKLRNGVSHQLPSPI
jgi:hypothetical protein